MELKLTLCNLRLNLVQLVKSDKGSNQDMDKVLSSLKRNKSRDPQKLINVQAKIN